MLTATDPGDAIKLVDAGRDPIDVLVTDIVMRGMHGHELAELLRDRWPRMKVLFMTGYPDEGARVLKKPLALDAVVGAVRYSERSNWFTIGDRSPYGAAGALFGSSPAGCMMRPPHEH